MRGVQEIKYTVGVSSKCSVSVGRVITYSNDNVEGYEFLQLINIISRGE